MKSFPILLILIYSLFYQQLVSASLLPNLCDEKRTIQCDEYSVCCPKGNDQYGCCPFTGGTCCPNHPSCCPAGFSCTNQGTCKRISING